MPTRTPPVPLAPKKKRVLYAEDQHSSRMVTTALLQRLGYDVDAVEDGERALEYARLSFYDLILLDIEMPIMDGVTAARKIRSENTPCAHSPILAMSAFLADSTECSQWRDAFDSALPKPANSNELRLAVARAIAAHPAPPASPDLLVNQLQTVLPRGAWVRLAASAATEMQALALTLSACMELEDRDNAAKTTKALASLASSFDVHDVEQACAVQPTLNVAKILVHIENWKRRVCG